MKNISLLILAIFISLLSGSAQQLTLRFPDTTAPIGQVNIPVYLTGNAEISHFDLMFKYWNFVATFPVIQNINPLVSDSLEVTYMPGGATDWVKIHWKSATPVNLSGNTLFDMELLYYGGSTTLEWLDYSDTICGFFDPAGNVIPTNFIDGSLNLANGIDESEIQDMLSISPNPVQSEDFRLSYAPLDKNADLWIYDVYGNKVFHSQLQRGTSSLQLRKSLVSSSSGVFFVEILLDSRRTTKKLVLF